MKFFDVIRTRQAIRKFSSTAVSDEALTRVLEAANCAPSAGNLQAYQIYVVKSPELRRRIDAASANQGAAAQAPVVLVFCAEPSRSAARFASRGEQLLCVQDATIACAYAQLAATALGLASVWIGAMHEPEIVKEILQLKDGLWPIALLPLGYPAEQPPRLARRPLAQLVTELT
jgi:nitroreductase